MSVEKQPWLGVAATALMILLALVFVAPLSWATFGGWVSFAMMRAIPFAVVVRAYWHGEEPSAIASLRQPVRGLAHLGLAAAVAAVVATVLWLTLGGRVSPPLPMLARATILSVVTRLPPGRPDLRRVPRPGRPRRRPGRHRRRGDVPGDHVPAAERVNGHRSRWSTSLTSGLKPPLRGVASVVGAIVVGSLLALLYRLVMPPVTGDLLPGRPPSTPSSGWPTPCWPSRSRSLPSTGTSRWTPPVTSLWTPPVRPAGSRRVEPQVRVRASAITSIAPHSA